MINDVRLYSAVDQAWSCYPDHLAFPTDPLVQRALDSLNDIALESFNHAPIHHTAEAQRRH